MLLFVEILKNSPIFPGLILYEFLLIEALGFKLSRKRDNSFGRGEIYMFLDGSVSKLFQRHFFTLLRHSLLSGGD
ncbi:MAG TPA: hypothetical protein DIT94_16405 [Deltaproteobacteria bacterium]|nr:hypothetical protein [Deltaproteobacteria bacterium]